MSKSPKKQPLPVLTKPAPAKGRGRGRPIPSLPKKQTVTRALAPRTPPQIQIDDPLPIISDFIAETPISDHIAPTTPYIPRDLVPTDFFLGDESHDPSMFLPEVTPFVPVRTPDPDDIINSPEYQNLGSSPPGVITDPHESDQMLEKLLSGSVKTSKTMPVVVISPHETDDQILEKLLSGSDQSSCSDQSADDDNDNDDDDDNDQYDVEEDQQSSSSGSEYESDPHAPPPPPPKKKPAPAKKKPEPPVVAAKKAAPPASRKRAAAPVQDDPPAASSRKRSTQAIVDDRGVKKPRPNYVDVIPDAEERAELTKILAHNKKLFEDWRLRYIGLSDEVYQLNPTFKREIAQKVRASRASSSSQKSKSSFFDPEKSEYWNLSLDDDLADYCPEDFKPFIEGRDPPHRVPVFKHPLKPHLLPNKFYDLVNKHAKALIYQPRENEPPREKARILIFNRDPTGKTKPVLPTLTNINNLDEIIAFFNTFSNSRDGKEMIRMLTEYTQDVRHAFDGPNDTWKTMTIYVMPQQMIGKDIFSGVVSEEPFVFAALPFPEEREKKWESNRSICISAKYHDREIDWIEPIDESTLTRKQKIDRNKQKQAATKLATDTAYNVISAFGGLVTEIKCMNSTENNTATICLLIN